MNRHSECILAQVPGQGWKQLGVEQQLGRGSCSCWAFWEEHSRGWTVHNGFRYLRYCTGTLLEHGFSSMWALFVQGVFLKSPVAVTDLCVPQLLGSGRALP